MELVRSGRVPESRIDASVRRLLRDKFRLGLFDNPFVDPGTAEETVGNSEFRAADEAAQRRSLTVLTNHERTLPVAATRPKLYVRGVSPDAAAAYGEVVADPAAAELAILRLRTPYEPREGRFEAFFHSGRLDFPEEELRDIVRLLESVPTLVCINLER